jgi:hypothetical protein
VAARVEMRKRDVKCIFAVGGGWVDVDVDVVVVVVVVVVVSERLGETWGSFWIEEFLSVCLCRCC